MQSKLKLGGVLLAATLIVTAFIGVRPSAANPQSLQETTQECFVGQRSTQAETAFGVVLGEIHIAGHWCLANGKVTSAQLLSSYAETSVPFGVWVETNELSTGADVVNNQAKIWKQFKLQFVVPTKWFSFTQPNYFCTRIIVDSEGTEAADDGCWAY